MLVLRTLYTVTLQEHEHEHERIEYWPAVFQVEICIVDIYNDNSV